MMAEKKQKNFNAGTTIDAQEISQFESLGEKWWDENGPMRPLHRLNPTRLTYIRDMACAHFSRDRHSLRPLEGLRAADIGCGGGLVAEPLCRMGAAVTGIDAGAQNIRVAKAHADKHGLEIDYRATTAEAVAHTREKFDIVTALEIVEHVADVPLFLKSCCALLKPNGLLILSTLNRTPKSYLLGIVAAEHVLRWLPAGTHDWKKFVKPSELADGLAPHGMVVADVRGLVYNPLSRAFSLSRDDISVNYFLTAARA